MDDDQVGPGTERWRHVPALLIAVGGLAPLAFVVLGSLRRPGPPPRSPELPWPLSPRNYSDAFELVGLGDKLVNSLVVAAVAVPVSVLVASAAGFGLARLPRRPRRVIAAITIGAAMIPTTALLVGRFGVFRALGVTAGRRSSRRRSCRCSYTATASSTCATATPPRRRW